MIVPKNGTRGKVRGSLKSLRFLLWASCISVPIRCVDDISPNSNSGQLGTLNGKSGDRQSHRDNSFEVPLTCGKNLL